jgi:uncharacterized protein YktA (UPF0223 family)
MVDQEYLFENYIFFNTLIPLKIYEKHLQNDCYKTHLGNENQ